MTTDKIHVAGRPCARCPFKIDTPPGEFPADRFEQLAHTSGTRDEQACLNASLFGCHKAPDGTLGVACAGWMRSIGYLSLRARVEAAFGRLDKHHLKPPPADWPPLFSTYADMARIQGRPDRGDDTVTLEGLRDDLNVLDRALGAGHLLDSGLTADTLHPVAVRHVADALGAFVDILGRLNGEGGDQLLWLLHAEGRRTITDLVTLTKWDEQSVQLRIDRETGRRVDAVVELVQGLDLDQDVPQLVVRAPADMLDALDDSDRQRLTGRLDDATLELAGRLRGQFVDNPFLPGGPETAGVAFTGAHFLPYLPWIVLDLTRQAEQLHAAARQRELEQARAERL